MSKKQKGNIMSSLKSFFLVISFFPFFVFGAEDDFDFLDFGLGVVAGLIVGEALDKTPDSQKKDSHQVINKDSPNKQAKLEKSVSSEKEKKEKVDSESFKIVATKKAEIKRRLSHVDKKIIERAVKGDPEAQLVLSKEYREAPFLDYAHADYWLNRSAKQGYMPALKLYYQQTGKIHIMGYQKAVENALSMIADSQNIATLGNPMLTRRTHSSDVQAQIKAEITGSSHSSNKGIKQRLTKNIRRHVKATKSAMGRGRKKPPSNHNGEGGANQGGSQSHKESVLGAEYNELIKKAERGEVGAQFELSQVYKEKGMTAGYHKYLTESANQGYVLAMKMFYKEHKQVPAKGVERIIDRLHKGNESPLTESANQDYVLAMKTFYKEHKQVPAKGVERITDRLHKGNESPLTEIGMEREGNMQSYWRRFHGVGRMKKNVRDRMRAEVISYIIGGKKNPSNCELLFIM